MPFEPMLAATRAPLPLRGEWALEPKFDGWRGVVAVNDGVRVWTRNNHELTQRLPELQPLADALNGRQVVLDGELVAGQGRASDFYGLLPRIAAKTRRAPLTFVAFDVLAIDGKTIIHLPYSERRNTLDGLQLDGPAWCATRQLHGTVHDALDACRAHDVEGVVAKRVGSPYRPGERSTDWLKLKTVDWRQYHAARRHEA
jgi:bifunctional non-homologous end joining protein LigD